MFKEIYIKDKKLENYMKKNLGKTVYCDGKYRIKAEILYGNGIVVFKPLFKKKETMVEAQVQITNECCGKLKDLYAICKTKNGDKKFNLKEGLNLIRVNLNDLDNTVLSLNIIATYKIRTFIDKEISFNVSKTFSKDLDERRFDVQ